MMVEFFKKLWKESYKGLWPVFFAINLLKFGYYGYQYLPISDDNNMYGTFAAMSPVKALSTYKMYTTRPVAAFLDAFVWSRFWNHLGIALFLMTLLLALSCWLLYEVFRKSGFHLGISAMVLITLLPYGSEASYWLAASSRIILGFFTVALSLYIFCVGLESAGDRRQSILHFLLFFLVNLISYGFYEQTLVMGFVLTMLIFAANWRRIMNRWLLLIPFVNLGIIGFWYKIFSSQGNMSTRGQMVSENVNEHFDKVTKAIQKVWELNNRELLQDGFAKGMGLVLSDGGYLFLGMVILLSIAVFPMAFHEPSSTGLKRNMLLLVAGVILFLAPFAPFYPIKLIWITNRNLFPSFLGLGLVVDGLINILAGRGPLRILKGALVCATVFILLISNVYELSYYRNLGRTDAEIVAKLGAMPLDEFFNKGRPLVLLNTKPYYEKTLSVRISNCTGTDWALLGAINVQLPGKKATSAYVFPDQGYATPLKAETLQKAIVLGMDDERNIFPLHREATDGRFVYFSTADGMDFGSLELLEGQLATFHLKN